MKNSISAHIQFSGNCRDAMQFYQACLGGELYLQKISESPMAAQLPSAKANYILFGRLQNEELLLLANDHIPGGLITGNNFSLCLQCNNMKQLKEYFSKLSKGGNIHTALHQTVYGDSFGNFTDQFGIHWILQHYK